MEILKLNNITRNHPTEEDLEELEDGPDYGENENADDE